MGFHCIFVDIFTHNHSVMNQLKYQYQGTSVCTVPWIWTWDTLCVDIITQLFSTMVDPCPHINLKQKVTAYQKTAS